MDRIIDLHCHPSMKMHYLPYIGRNFHSLMPTPSGWNPFSFRYQYANLKKSPVKVIVATHYVVEKGFLHQGIKPHSRAFLWSTFPYFYWKMRKAEPWQAVKAMMDTLEAGVRNTNRLVFGDNPKLRMVGSPAEIDALADDEIGVVHAIEGAHVFGYELENGQTLDDYWQRTLRRLDELETRGVSMIGLAHFWDNMFIPQTDGTEVIPKVRNQRVVPGRDDLLVYMKRADWTWGDRQHLGEQLVRELFTRGIVADLTHVQEHAREAILDLAAEYDRPVIYSHVGLKHFFNHEYNVSDDEIRAIHGVGGVIGLIISKRLLVDPIKRYRDNNEGLADLVENMTYIRDLVGDVSCIGLGTDFDGLTHPFADCYHPGMLHDLIRLMKTRFSPEEIDAILYGNALRAFKRGWGKGKSAKQQAG